MTRGADIEQLLRTGRRVRARLLDVRRLDSTHGHVRVAIVVPKFGFNAVRRNKLKRQLRELARMQLLSRGTSTDVLLRARREAYGATFETLREDVAGIGTRLDPAAP